MTQRQDVQQRYDTHFNCFSVYYFINFNAVIIILSIMQVLHTESARQTVDARVKYEYLFINSVSLKDSGSYTCTSTQLSNKTIKLTVFGKLMFHNFAFE